MKIISVIEKHYKNGEHKILSQNQKCQLFLSNREKDSVSMNQKGVNHNKPPEPAVIPKLPTTNKHNLP